MRKVEIHSWLKPFPHLMELQLFLIFFAAPQQFIAQRV